MSFLSIASQCVELGSQPVWVLNASFLFWVSYVSCVILGKPLNFSETCASCVNWG